MSYIKVKLSELKPAIYNPRKISKKAKIGLGESIERFGLVQPIVWNKRSGNIVGGHQRYEFLKEKKIEETTVYEVDLTDTEEKALNIELNNTAIQGEWTEKIDSLLEDIRKGNTNLYERLKFDELQSQLDKEAGINMQCPCCSYKWNLKKSHSKIASEEDLRILNDTGVQPTPPPSAQDEEDVEKLAEEMSDDSTEEVDEDNEE